MRFRLFDYPDHWYNQPDYQASNKEIITKYNLPKSNFNFDVMHLGRRIVKYLNRFEDLFLDLLLLPSDFQLKVLYDGLR